MTRHDDASWEAAILPRLRTGEPAAQRELVRRYNATLMRQALLILEDRALAEEVVQVSWMAALARIRRFRGRSRLLTWIAGIVINRARSERRREIRSVRLSSLIRSDQWPGRAANEDTEGWELPETCQVLDISDAAQRVRLCRARATLRDALRELGPAAAARETNGAPHSSD
jgi:RNA polymerase sigma factor (sigma-70 family)